jgi:pyruvate dehydrogenase E1 component beta subunit
MGDIRYIDGLRQAIELEMERDKSVIVLGEDVAVGGPFGVTAGLVDRFGDRRVTNTPISEDSIMGVATGLALAGKRPIVEIMFIDFVTLAMSQLVNHAAKMRYMSGGQLSVPMVIRLQQGAVGGWGAQHSQSLEAWFQHVPGLKMVAPSNAADAFGLLRAAIRDDDPVLFLEHRGLYFRKDAVDDSEAVPSLGAAKVVSPGEDLTIITYSKMVWEAVAAAQELATRGISAEVIDLRSLSPLDMDTIVRSVQRTHRALIAHEAVIHGGMGAEIVARIQESAFDWLDAPVQRVGAPFAPVPASPVLEDAFVPTAKLIVANVEQMLGLQQNEPMPALVRSGASQKS